jgi:MFS family permease
MFAAFALPNFRLFFAGQSISLVGTWMQIVAQGWLVLMLTHSATKVGLLVAIQTLPILFFAPYGGLVADRLNKRVLLIGLQSFLGVLALLLGILTVTHVITLWEVYVIALVLGTANAFENPTRQSFLLEMVGADNVRNAVSLNSVMVNAARAVGPAIAGIIIAVGGLGICFLLNAASYIAVVACLLLMNVAALMPSPKTLRAKGQLRDGFAYIARTPSLLIPLLMMAIVGCFAYEFQVTLPYMAEHAFHGDSRTYGFMTAAMGLGAVVGGLYVAARGRTGIQTMVKASTTFGVVIMAAALAPSAAFEIVALFFVGAASVSLMARGNSTLQITSDPEMRGRVMAFWAVAFLGTTPLGGPIAGWVAETFGPRWGLVLGAMACLAAAGLGAYALMRKRAGAHLPQHLQSLG